MIDGIRSCASRYAAAVAAFRATFDDNSDQARENEYAADMIRATFARILVDACLYNAELRGRLGSLNVLQAQAALVRGALYARQGSICVAFVPEPATEFYQPEPGTAELDLIQWNQRQTDKTADAILSQLARDCDDEVHLSALGWMVGWLVAGDAAGETYELGSMY